MIIFRLLIVSSAIQKDIWLLNVQIRNLGVLVLFVNLKTTWLEIAPTKLMTIEVPNDIEEEMTMETARADSALEAEDVVVIVVAVIAEVIVVVEAVTVVAVIVAEVVTGVVIEEEGAVIEMGVLEVAVEALEVVVEDITEMNQIRKMDFPVKCDREGS